jgi:hypothetical protein
MTINLDNYEQVFSLYVDNELSAAGREAVEAFLKTYPYLQEELELLQHTKLIPEAVSFFDKSSLLKPVISDEMQSSLLLHLDKELGKTAGQDLEKEIAGNELLNKEWQLLQKTKLSPADTIEFPYKEDLYRKEDNRVIRMPWLRWAAAAVVLGFGIYMTATLIRPAAGPAEMVANEGVNPPAKTSVPAVQQTNVNDPLIENSPVTNEPKQALDQQYAANTENKVKTEPKPVDDGKQLEKIKKNAGQQNEMLVAAQPKKLVEKNKTGIVNQQEINNEPEFSGNRIAALQTKNSGNTINLNEINSSSRVKNPVIDDLINPSSSPYAQTASLNFDQNDNSVFLMDEDNISRSKAGILLKKLKRNVERRANLKPGKSLRIAGFEFAVK